MTGHSDRRFKSERVLYMMSSHWHKKRTDRLRALEAQGVQFDEEDRSLLELYSWKISPKGYVEAASYIPGEPMTVKMHRVVMGFPPYDLDHENRNKRDNRKENLRPSNPILNGNNKDAVEDAKHVRFHRGVWELRISRNGVKHHLSFKTEEEALAARYQIYRL